MKVKDVAALSGISVRTLHHYDAIGLLRPEKVTNSGYRNYSDEDLSKLQQILFFKELGFPLKKIKELISDEKFNRLETLQTHQELLLQKREKLDLMLATIEKTIQKEKGGEKMANEEKFKGFDFRINPYEKEAREKYGDQKVDEATNKVENMTEENQEEMNEIYRELAAIKDTDPTSEKAQLAIKKWYNFLQDNFSTYSPEAFQGLGMMYMADERFTKNIDQFGSGLAQFMSEAMNEFGKRLKK
ncbi:MerR family transcriptional regulator [Saliterribacillus persicus]|uniref:MerR family transcriptional regulator n=1 Tax=Saliterribacillus persicus TaxID=930114 RepID=A0A368YBU9_9BACI|nr:MerR family transcriptional regulator [Saliterribacillus persicus]RCW76908.1 MerR family transcriptional regulator [Saliterribacillus persicus]